MIQSPATRLPVSQWSSVETATSAAERSDLDRASKSASQRVRSGSIGSSCSSFAFSSSSVALSRFDLPVGTNGQNAPRLNP